MTNPDRFLVAGAGVALITAALGIWLLIAPDDQPAFDPGTGAVAFAHDASPAASVSARSSEPPGVLVIDVEGGVAQPGIVKLDAGARVADAIIAAGGYSTDADLLAAAQINLAAVLTDGQQVLVPVRNATPLSNGGAAGNGSGGPGGAGGGSSAAPLNLNQATPEQLDALPGIGPVTVQKIVAARQERPFATLDELVERKVLTSSQLEKIRDQVTVG